MTQPPYPSIPFPTLPPRWYPYPAKKGSKDIVSQERREQWRCRIDLVRPREAASWM